MWERGLKAARYMDYGLAKASLPMWERGLKV